MGSTKRAGVAAVSLPSGAGKAQTSGQSTMTGSGSPVTSSGHPSCLASQLRKTKMCVYHLKGSCQYGDRCTFAHSCVEMQSVPDLRKTRLCQAYEQGGCNNKDCGFAHGDEELRSANLFYKKTLCIWNQKGKCRNGDQCRFAHGTSELRANQGGNGGQGSHGAQLASGKQAAARGGNGAKMLTEPMKVLAAGCLPTPQPAVLPATLPVEAFELDQTLPGEVPTPGLPFLPDVYGGLKDVTLPGAFDAWWQWPLSYGMVPQFPNAMSGTPGAGIEDLKADLERLRHNILNKTLAPDIESIREEVASLTQKCNEIQMQMETASPNLAGANSKNADLTSMGSYLKAAPGLMMESAGGGGSQLPMY